MLNYRKLELDVYYDTVNNDVIEEFYAPVLSNSKLYKRASAYFSLDALIFLSRPLGNFLKNNGIAKFIMSVEMSEKDYKFYDELFEKIITKKILREIEVKINSETGIDVNLTNLAYLINMGKIEVKIAVKKPGIFHDKFAIFEDGKGNQVGFIGSLNETPGGMKKNSESFTVRKSYTGSEDDIKFFEMVNVKFDQLWNNIRDGYEVYELPTAIKEKLIRISADNYNFDNNSFNSDFVYLKNNNGIYYIDGSIQKFSKASYFYNVKIKTMIKEITSDMILLKKISDYMMLKKCIARIREYTVKIGLKFVVTSDILNELIQKDMKIAQRRKLGTYIKNKEEIILGEFLLYKEFMTVRLNRPLTENQLWDSFHCIQMIRSSNYSVPGTGKTAMVLAAFYYLRSIGEVSKLIVCGPLNSRKSWRDEIKKVFKIQDTLSFIDIKQFNKSESEKNSFFRERIVNYDVIFINHESLKSLKTQLSRYNDINYFLCIDEIHKFKNYQSSRYELARDLFKENRYKISLTGTPIPNGFGDFYSQLNIIYTHEYDMFFGYTPEQLQNIDGDVDEIKKFNDLYQPFFCRTTKKDLNIKPPKNDYILKTKMSVIEGEIYDLIRVNLYSNKLLMYIRLIQLTTIPHCLDSSVSKSDIINMTTDSENNDRTIQYAPLSLSTDILQKASMIETSSKIEKAIHVISSVLKAGRNILVWAIFIETHEKLKKKLNEIGINAEVINGNIGVEDRESIIEEFKRGEFDVLISNPHTMAESVSLHIECHDALYVEFDFNLTHNLQSRDRIHRLGVPNDVDTRYYYIVSTFANSNYKTADQYIYKKLEEKRDNMLKIVESDLIDTLPVDDINDILKLIV